MQTGFTAELKSAGAQNWQKFILQPDETCDGETGLYGQSTGSSGSENQLCVAFVGVRYWKQSRVKRLRESGYTYNGKQCCGVATYNCKTVNNRAHSNYM